mmetsp:Transcript_106645/g.318788  ORF Transcript_106645/g.318788 Transcript_106645/m.318788 type:complete len:300 (+) Transcript_106645:287-1186(+)
MAVAGLPLRRDVAACRYLQLAPGHMAGRDEAKVLCHTEVDGVPHGEVEYVVRRADPVYGEVPVQEPFVVQLEGPAGVPLRTSLHGGLHGAGLGVGPARLPDPQGVVRPTSDLLGLQTRRLGLVRHHAVDAQAVSGVQEVPALVPAFPCVRYEGGVEVRVEVEGERISPPEPPCDILHEGVHHGVLLLYERRRLLLLARDLRTHQGEGAHDAGHHDPVEARHPAQVLHTLDERVPESLVLPEPLLALVAGVHVALQVEKLHLIPDGDAHDVLRPQPPQKLLGRLPLLVVDVVVAGVLDAD